MFNWLIDWISFQFTLKFGFNHYWLFKNFKTYHIIDLKRQNSSCQYGNASPKSSPLEPNLHYFVATNPQQIEVLDFALKEDERVTTLLQQQKGFLFHTPCTVANMFVEPLSLEYFDQLSADIGDGWTRLADKLMLCRPAIQRITQSNASYNSATERSQRCARQTLLQWFRSSSRSHNRVRKNSSQILNKLFS